MKRFFWFVLLLLLIITFSGKEPIKPYRDTLYQQILQQIPTSWQSETQALQALQQEVTTYAQSLGQGQQEFLAKASANVASITQFRQRYCIDRNFNPVLFGEPLQKSCAIVEKYYYRFNGN